AKCASSAVINALLHNGYFYYYWNGFANNCKLCYHVNYRITGNYCIKSYVACSDSCTGWTYVCILLWYCSRYYTTSCTSSIFTTRYTCCCKCCYFNWRCNICYNTKVEYKHMFSQYRNQ